MMQVNTCKLLILTKQEDGGGSRLSRIIVMLLGTGSGSHKACERRRETPFSSGALETELWDSPW